MTAGEKRKFICLHCGTIFESDQEAPRCPNCRRKRVIPLDVFKASIEKHKDVLEKEGILPKVENDDKPVPMEARETSKESSGGIDPANVGFQLGFLAGEGMFLASLVAEYRKKIEALKTAIEEGKANV